MKIFRIVTAVLLFISVFGSFGASLASDITGAVYYGVINAINSAASEAIAVAANISGMETADFINSGYLNATATNCAIRNASGVDAPFMPGVGANPWVFYPGNIASSGVANYILYVKGVTGGKIVWFPGATGMTVPNTITAPGANFEFTFTNVFINTDAGATKNIIEHFEDATHGLRLRVSSSVSGTVEGIVSAPGGTFTVSAAGIATGEHDITIGLSGGTLTLTIDGVASTVASDAVPAIGAGWTFCLDSVVMYVESIAYSQGGAPVSAWAWEYGTTFQDSIGANDGTPSFRTTTTDADVTATLSSFMPLNEPDAPAYSVSDSPDFITGVISANETPLSVNGTAALDYPLKELIDSVSDDGDLPRQWLPTILGTLCVLFASMIASYFLKSSGGMSIFVKSVVNIVGYGILIALNIFDWWMLLIFFIFEQSIWFAAKERRE